MTVEPKESWVTVYHRRHRFRIGKENRLMINLIMISGLISPILFSIYLLCEFYSTVNEIISAPKHRRPPRYMFIHPSRQMCIPTDKDSFSFNSVFVMRNFYPFGIFIPSRNIINCIANIRGITADMPPPPVV